VTNKEKGIYTEQELHQIPFDSPSSDTTLTKHPDTTNLRLFRCE